MPRRGSDLMHFIFTGLYCKLYINLKWYNVTERKFQLICIRKNNPSWGPAWDLIFIRWENMKPRRRLDVDKKTRLLSALRKAKKFIRYCEEDCHDSTRVYEIIDWELYLKTVEMIKRNKQDSCSESLSPKLDLNMGGCVSVSSPDSNGVCFPRSVSEVDADCEMDEYQEIEFEVQEVPPVDDNDKDFGNCETFQDLRNVMSVVLECDGPGDLPCQISTAACSTEAKSESFDQQLSDAVEIAEKDLDGFLNKEAEPCVENNSQVGCLASPQADFPIQELQAIGEQFLCQHFFPNATYPFSLLKFENVALQPADLLENEMNGDGSVMPSENMQLPVHQGDVVTAQFTLADGKFVIAATRVS